MRQNKDKIVLLFLSIGVIAGLLAITTGFVLHPAQPAHAATTYTVTTNADSGAGSLRQAIIDANANAGADTIVFDNAYSIQILTSLPTITEQVEINGYTGSPGGATANSAVSPAPFNGNLTIEIDGTNIPINTGACFLLDGASNSVIRGLVINNCGKSGILMQGSNNVVIAGNYIGTDTTGLIDQGNGRGYVVTAIANGIEVNYSNNLTIGGTAAADRNIIAGNQSGDIFIGNEGDNANLSENNTIQGNYVGVGADGTTALPSGYANGNGNGLLLGNSHNDQIGGTVTGAINVFGSSYEYGVGFRDGSSGTTVEGNYIGTDYTGNATLAHALGAGNISAGLHVGMVSNGGFVRPSHDITIGGTTSASRNVISGNSNSGGSETGGLYVDDGAYNVVVAANFIGLGADGATDVGNEGNGMQLGTQGGSATYNITVGGDTAGERNVISGNGNGGIAFLSEISSTTILGNYIGTDSAGTASVSNAGSGIDMIHPSIIPTSITIGGDASSEGNIISGNGWAGINLDGSNITNVTISANYIGTNAAGDAAIANTSFGVTIANGAHDIAVGGLTGGERNIISGNNQDGVSISGLGSTGNMVIGNYIGTDVTGAVDLGNSQNGVSVSDSASDNTFGGTVSGAGNVISGNNSNGVAVGSGVTSITLQGNYIGTDINGTTDLGNTNDGLHILSGSDGLTIGGTADGARNVISGNGDQGIDTRSDSTTILGNYIGISANGQSAIGNSDAGIYSNGANTVVGGTVSGSRNVISSNGNSGISLEGDSGLVQDNLVGTSSDGLSPLGNANYGIIILGANGNNATIGGSTSSARNVVSATTNGGLNAAGIMILGFGTANTGNKILGNYIGTNINGDVVTGFGNGAMGVGIIGSSINNIVGGINSGEGNKIAGNTTLGVFVYSLTQFGLETKNNSILGNSITENGSTGIRLADSDGSDGFSPTTPEPYPNDPGDTDEITNHFMNFPEISAVTSTNGQVTITYNLDINDAEVGATGYRVEFFANDAADPSGHGEGQTYLGSDTVSGDVTGRQATFTLPAGVSGNKFISSTTTMTDASADGFGHTSEFSADIQSTLVPVSTNPIINALAITGRNMKWILPLALILITLGSTVLFVLYKKRQQQNL